MSKIKTFAVTDFEASKWINYLCNGYYDGKTYLEFTDLSDYFDFLHETDIPNIFAHFGGIYDFLFLLGWIFDNDEYTLKNLIPRGSAILCFTIISNRNQKEFTFLDSSALLGFSLRNLAINFNVETLKGEIDYNSLTKVTPELLAYMKDDHLALYQVLERFFQWDLIALHGWKPTLASLALNIFKKEFYPKKKKLYSLDKDLDRFVRKSYQGGRTEIFNMVYDNEKKPLYCYDVNSLYPTVMRDSDFPSKPKFSTNEFLPDEMGFYHCRVFAPEIHIPILGAKCKVIFDNGIYKKVDSMSELEISKIKKKEIIDQFLFPVGEFSGYWTTNELNYAIKNGYKILEIYQGVVFENDGKIFKNYVNYFYNKRKNSKTETDKIICKLLLNSLYGRFGMDTEKDQLHLEKHCIGETYHSTIKTPSGNEVIFCTSKEEIRTFTNVAVASYVTSYARILMHKILVKDAKNKVWYMDTDSVFTTVKLKTGVELGNLKEEYKVKKACFMLPKTYLVEGVDFSKVVMKGFDKKKIQHFTYSDFMSSLEGDLKIMNKENTNRLKIKQDSKVMKFKTALRNGKMLGMTKIQTRKICSKYNKRIINDDFTTRAISL